MPAFAAREGLDSTDARATARALLAMSVTEFQQQFRGSPMKRATGRYKDLGDIEALGEDPHGTG